MIFIRKIEILSRFENLRDSVVVRESIRGWRGLRFVDVVLVKEAQFIQVGVHGIRGHEGEESVDAVLRVVLGQGAEDQSTHNATEAKSAGITLTISEAPGSEVVRSEIMSEEAVSASEGDGVTQDSSTDSITYTQT